MKNILRFSCDLDTHWSASDTSSVSFSIESLLGTFTEDSNDLLTIVKQPYIPQRGDKIYFLPEVSVPRVKFKNVCVEYGIKTVRDITQANVFFGCSKSTHYMTNNKWDYKLPTSDFKAFIEVLNHRLDGHTKDKIETALEFYDNDDVAISWNIMNNIGGALPSHNGSKYSQRLVTIDEDFREEYEHLKSITIYDESIVIDILNGEDATVINKEMYEHLSEMFRSSDTDNHVLAMEIMANSKYTESLIYLELLFNAYASKIMDIHSKNHVNFKSLVSYLDKNMRYLHTDIDDIVDSLVNKSQFTVDKLEIIMEYLSEEIQNRGDSKYFTVKTITVHPDYIAQLGSNYTYGVQDDFVGPEVPIEFEEEDEDMGEMIAIIGETELAHDLYGVDNDNIEVTLKIELLPTNLEITQTNEPTDIDWF